MEAEKVGSEVRPLECESRLSDFLAVWSWTGQLTLENLSVLICNMGLPHQTSLEELMCVKP